ncbi:hypothetical protein [Cupriavidus pauculus]|uniref:hypothetical protein n=1 Tax=Cupriavidus pauculus TaxID=82633 RepID=UPI001FCF7F3A|nr:hypothetical protein [Cupriavidus pauculus]
MTPFNSMAAREAAAAYAKCMARTKQERLTCKTDCGMILQGCYDEGVDEINEKIDSLVALMNASGNMSCASLAEEYSLEALKVDENVVDKGNTHAGWFGAELKLYLAKQRLAALQFIQKTCK